MAMTTAVRNSDDVLEGVEPNELAPIPSTGELPGESSCRLEASRTRTGATLPAVQRLFQAGYDVGCDFDSDGETHCLVAGAVCCGPRVNGAVGGERRLLSCADG